MGVLMKKEMSNACVGKDHWFFFGSTLTHYLRHHEVFEEEADYRLQVSTSCEHVTRSRHPDDIHGMTLSTAQCHAMNDSITSNIYAMQRLQLTLGATAATHEHLQTLMSDSHSPHDDYVPTPELEPHEELANEEEAETAAQSSESDSDDGDSNHAPTGSDDEEQDDDNQSAAHDRDNEMLKS
ncbi:hypothetical protein RND71_016993 [Anisodus tanguticus]|uniref:Uncharacterized protein n=1 Tax=Anisodus tanguticus TaxID=243964 RepID=A0AAE1S1Z0_9SOLA|nr:hypothetical protein RND71_016993 [Anisodus tanguticus]